ncbi:TRAP transporter substrate-binding protein DctP [Comamonas sp. JC664]|uniref:TRAP transporter substrate-binding protein DctP n=1 Tax=Comamonas sp. JC664 TaxID=2801917 RepID=UPI00360B77FF
MALASFNAMGMNAVPMAFSEVYPALEIKALDGYEHPVVDMYANKMYEVAEVPDHHQPCLHARPVALIASEKWWSGLTPAQQQAVQQSAEKARTLQRSEELRQAGEVVAQLQSHGMQVGEMPAAELEKIALRCSRVIDKNQATVGQEFAQSFYAALASYRNTKR